MVEAVRLVIWDLDETFWKGTLTEGGITEIPSEHLEIIKELSRRGIVNSICSKNNHSEVKAVLDSHGIYDHFIFPSIDWSAKGPRVKTIVENVSLRPETIMFIDDNHGNRAEVSSIIPNIQVEDELFIPNILNDWRFAGKSDPQLSRLQQYKVLETKLMDKSSTKGSNEEFLRNSNIRVKIEYNLDDKLGRVVELINRTNQLNFTKVRLPEDASESEQILRHQLNQFNIQAGLISVVDKYGAYGDIGFFMLSSLHEISNDGKSRGQLIHFCFSCRTLGMLVEQWVYNYLGKPRLSVAGEVLTDLSVDRDIDWITRVDSFESVAVSQEPQFSKITLFGGCEANAVAVYLQAQTDNLACYGNYQSNGCFVRTASAIQALNMCEMSPEDVKDTAKSLGLPLARVAENLFAEVPEGAVFIFNCSGDAGNGAHFRHKQNGMTLNMEPPYLTGLRFLTEPKESILSAIGEDRHEMRQHVEYLYEYLNSNFDLVESVPDDQRLEAMRRLIEKTPAGSKFIIMADHDFIRTGEDELTHIPWFTKYASDMRDLADRYDFCGFVSYSQILSGDHEIQLHGNHYNREVYLRTANTLCEVASALTPRAGE